MYLLESTDIQCPYCAETISISVDCSVPEQSYIEDCQVCCRPIAVHSIVDEDGIASVSVKHENE